MNYYIVLSLLLSGGFFIYDYFKPYHYIEKDCITMHNNEYCYLITYNKDYKIRFIYEKDICYNLNSTVTCWILNDDIYINKTHYVDDIYVLNHNYNENVINLIKMVLLLVLVGFLGIKIYKIKTKME